MLLNQHSAFVWHPDIAARSQRAIAATGNHISHHFADADHVRHSKCSIWVTHDSPGSSGVGMGPAKREYLLTGHTPNPPRQRRHESFPCLFSQSECRQWSEEKTSMGVIFLLQLSKVDSAKKIPATFGGSVVHVRARGREFQAAMADISSAKTLGPLTPQLVQNAWLYISCVISSSPGHNPTLNDEQIGDGFSSGMVVFSPPT